MMQVASKPQKERLVMKRNVYLVLLLSLGLASAAKAAPRAQSWKAERAQSSDQTSFKCPSCKKTINAVQKGHRPVNLSRSAKHTGEHGANCKLYKAAALASVDRVSLNRGPNTPHR